MNTLMALRNQAVRLKGPAIWAICPLASATNRPAPTKWVTVGIFSLKHLHSDEVIVLTTTSTCGCSCHCSKHRERKPVVSLSTVVHIHNCLGRFYMAIVGPVHSVIVPRMLVQVAHA